MPFAYTDIVRLSMRRMPCVCTENGEVDDTVELMKKVVWKYIGDTKKVAQYLKADSVIRGYI
jgi:hypothetical protein